MRRGLQFPKISSTNMKVGSGVGIYIRCRRGRLVLACARRGTRKSEIYLSCGSGILPCRWAYRPRSFRDGTGGKLSSRSGHLGILTLGHRLPSLFADAIQC